MVDEDGDRVRRLAEDETLEDRVITVFRWNGRTDEGGLAPPGTYSLRVYQHRRDRTITPGEETVLGALPTPAPVLPEPEG